MDDINRSYKILGLEPGATPEEVKQAYRDLVRVWHPDHYAHDPRLQKKAEEKLKEIIEAYEKINNFYSYKSKSQEKEKKEYKSEKKPDEDQPQPEPKTEPKTEQHKPVKRGSPFLKTIWPYLIIGIIILILIYSRNPSEVSSPNNVLNIPPSAPEVSSQEDWKGRGLALEKAQDWDGLLAWCRRWTQAEPGNAVAWNSLGVAYGYLGRYPEAIAAYREALHLKPDNAAAWYLLGVAYEGLGSHQEAIAAYREALHLKPDDSDAWYNLATAYARSGNRRAALKAIKELRRYDPQKADKIFNLVMKP